MSEFLALGCGQHGSNLEQNDLYNEEFLFFYKEYKLILFVADTMADVVG